MRTFIIFTGLIAGTLGGCGGDDGGDAASGGTAGSGAGTAGSSAGTAGSSAGTAGSGAGTAGSGGTSTGDALTQAEYCAASGELYCGVIITCCDASGVTIPEATCAAAIAAQCLQELERGAPYRVYDGAAAAECVDQFPPASTSCGTAAVGDACARVFVPGTSGQCETSSDCPHAETEGATCVSSGDPVGTCQTVVRQPAGADCENSTQCGLDAFCNASGACELKRAAGQPCESPDECASLGCEANVCASTRFTPSSCQRIAGEL